MDWVDSVIIGGGIIGLATAYQLSKRWPDKSFLLLEKEDSFGRGLSSRTSEVIHSGIYYPSGSLKAELCVTGNRMLYEFCFQHHVPVDRLGKLIVAQDEQELEKLEVLRQQAVQNMVPDITLLTRSQLSEIEPAVHAQAALLCPSSGIVDSHRLMAQLAYGAKANGAMLVYQQEVTGIQLVHGGYCLEFRDAKGVADSIHCKSIINAGGLAADQIAAMAGINVDESGYRIYRCKGEYFAVNNRKSALVSKLIFPVSIRELKGSGIPIIKDLKGRLRLGPDAHYASAAATDHSVQPSNSIQFFKLVQRYLPFLELTDLQPDLAGIRPRLLVPCGSPPRDFVICHEKERGLPGFINLIGIESPGITCCLSLAELVSDMLAEIIV